MAMVIIRMWFVLGVLLYALLLPGLGSSIELRTIQHDSFPSLALQETTAAHTGLWSEPRGIYLHASHFQILSGRLSAKNFISRAASL